MQTEPKFDELLAGPYPTQPPEMPKERPSRLHCFIPRDAEYFAELERLKQAVVVHTAGFQWELSVDNVCDYACRTNLVSKEEIQISALSRSRFLIMLPEGLAPDTFINATPQDAWDEGMTFQPWTPLEDAAISIPAYKILLRLVDIPPHLFKERHVAQAVSRFGVFLGSVAPEDSSSLASWLVAVGVDDLTLVPPELVVHIGGMVHTVQVHTIAYHRAPLYTADDMPKQPKIYRRPQPPPSSSGSSDNENTNDDLQLIPMSSRVLRELCRGKTAETLPPELRQFATMEEMDFDYPHMAAQEGATADPTAQNLGVSKNSQPVRKLLADQVGQTTTKEGVTGHEMVLLDQTKASTHATSHSQSSGVSPPIPISRQTLRRSERNEDAGFTAIPISATGPVEAQNKRRIHGATRTKPQSILLKGDSSKSQSTAVAKIPGGAESARTQRGILFRNENTSKKETGKHKGINRGVIISEKAATNPQESLNDGHGSREQQPEFIFQARGKAQFGGPFNNGPYARKYKWTRPVPPNNAQITKKIIAGAGNKRKNPNNAATGQAKKIAVKGKEKEQAEVSFNSEGFYEVKVHYEHISKLAEGCGFTNNVVEEVIKTDNAQRQLAAANAATITPTNEEDEADLSRFELDPNDDLSSEEEEA